MFTFQFHPTRNISEPKQEKIVCSSVAIRLSFESRKLVIIVTTQVKDFNNL